MKRPYGFTLAFDRLDPMRDLSNEEKGIVFVAIWEYAESGVIPTLPPHLMIAWRALRPNVDDGTIKYNEKCTKNRYTAYCRELNKKEKDKKDPPAIWKWWASQPDYTPELFKKETWYDDAAAEYEKRHTTPVNDCTRTLTNVTNPSPYQYPGPGPYPSPGPGPNPSPSPGPSTGNMELAEIAFAKAEQMKREAREENYRSITSGAASNDKGR